MPTGDFQQTRVNTFRQHGMLPGCGTAGVESFDPVMRVRVDTNVKESGEIEQIVTGVGGEISRFVMSARNEQVRAALIALGWTPPPIL